MVESTAREYDGKVVIVTGGAQGIGMGVSQAFAKAGAKVIIADLDAEAGHEHASTLSTEGFLAEFVQTDVAEESQVERLADTVLAKHGRIDVVINNAGIGANGSLFDRTMEEWDRVIGVNLRGPYMMAKYCGRALMATEGAIVNIASTRGLMSEAGTEPYSASKGGILALTHSLAVSLGPKVRVNAISPGWIEVGDWKKATAKTLVVHSAEDKSQHPVGRVGTPLDIAEACLFLASSKAGFITGQNLVIDGGMTIRMIYV